MISESGFVALRRAATLVHAVPAMRARLRVGDQVVVDVARDGAPRPPGARAVTPCGFRTAVANAWRCHRSGERLALRGVPVDVEPSVDLGIPPGGRTFPGDVHRVPLAGRLVYVFASTFGLEGCRARVDHHLCDVAPPPGSSAVRLRHDDATDVTLLYAEIDAERRARSEPLVVDALQSLMADIAVRQLLDELSTAAG